MTIALFTDEYAIYRSAREILEVYNALPVEKSVLLQKLETQYEAAKIARDYKLLKTLKEQLAVQKSKDEEEAKLRLELQQAEQAEDWETAERIQEQLSLLTLGPEQHPPPAYSSASTE